jgi:phosphoribosylanthranilate isomerase
VLLLMLKLKIKASQITNLTDARYFAAKEVEWLSFNFTEHTDNYIEPMRARAMFDWVEVPHIIGEFDSFDADAVNFYTENWGLKAVQVGESSEIFNLKSDYIIKEIIIDSATTVHILRGMLLPFAGVVAAFQLNFELENITFSHLKAGKHPLSINDLLGVCAAFNTILAIDFLLNELDEILAIKPFGLSLKGGEEERVGVKSFDELDEIFDRLEIEE